MKVLRVAAVVLVGLVVGDGDGVTGETSEALQELADYNTKNAKKD